MRFAQRKDDSAARRFQLHDAHTLQTFNMNAKKKDQKAGYGTDQVGKVL